MRASFFLRTFVLTDQKMLLPLTSASYNSLSSTLLVTAIDRRHGWRSLVAARIVSDPRQRPVATMRSARSHMHPIARGEKCCEAAKNRSHVYDFTLVRILRECINNPRTFTSNDASRAARNIAF
jgi:hypothetical protein